MHTIEPCQDIRLRQSGVQWELYISQLIFTYFLFTHTHTHNPSWTLSANTHISLPALFFLFNASVLPLGQQPSAKPISKCCLHHTTFVAILMSGHFNFLFLGRFKVQMLKVKPRSSPEGARLWTGMRDAVARGNNKLLCMNNIQPFLTLFIYYSHRFSL